VREDFQAVQPVEMDWAEGGDMLVAWSDGHRSRYTRPWLREHCPCAECTGAHGTEPKAFKAFPILNDAQAAGAGRETLIESVEPVGHYAIRFQWGDGHNDGIYSFSFLRDQCPCEDCVARRGGR